MKFVDAIADDNFARDDKTNSPRQIKCQRQVKIPTLISPKSGEIKDGAPAFKDDKERLVVLTVL